MHVQTDNSNMGSFKNYKLFLLITLFYFSVVTFAAEQFELTKDSKCTNKRLDQVPGTCASVPVHDQDGTGLCGTYATTQMIDCWRATNDKPVKQWTSPFAFSTEYAARTNKSSLVGFEFLEVLNFASQNQMNSCSYNVIKDNFNSKTPSSFIGELSKYYNEYSQKKTSLDDSAAKSLNCLMNAGVGNQTRISLEKIKNYLNNYDRVIFINKLLEDACEDARVPLKKLPKVVAEKSIDYGTHTKGMSVLRDLINKRLDMTNPQPVGIKYCRDVLADKSIIGVSPKGNLNTDTCKGEVHASVIVGRRLLKYKVGSKTETICQYLVRDSYGSSCNAYPDDESAEPKEVCENGQVWVDEDALMNNTNQVYHFEDR